MLYMQRYNVVTFRTSTRTCENENTNEAQCKCISNANSSVFFPVKSAWNSLILQWGEKRRSLKPDETKSMEMIYSGQRGVHTSVVCILSGTISIVELPPLGAWKMNGFPPFRALSVASCSGEDIGTGLFMHGRPDTSNIVTVTLCITRVTVQTLRYLLHAEEENSYNSDNNYGMVVSKCVALIVDSPSIDIII